MIYIFWSCRGSEEARGIIESLLSERLIACASIFPPIESFYRWEDKLECSQEVKVLLKTIPSHFSAIQAYIESHCTYTTPEIVQIDIAKASPSYLSWLTAATHPL